MKTSDIIKWNALIILFGAIVFYLDHIEFKDSNNKILIFAFALIKSGYFLRTGFKKVIKLSVCDISYYKFLLYISLNISFIIASFASDYFCLFQVDPDSFTGISEGLNYFEKGFKFFYFSVLIFSNLGIANILPASSATEFLVMLEAIFSFITIIFILSDFVSLKDSLKEYVRTKSRT